MLFVILATVVVAVAAGLLTAVQPVTYVSRATFVLESTASASQTETLVRNMLALIPDEAVAGDLKRITGAPQSVDDITEALAVSRPPGASVITVAYTDEEAVRSRQVCDALGPVLQSRVQSLGGVTGTGPQFTLEQWNRNATSTERVAPPVVRNTLVGLLVGLAVGLAASVLAPVGTLPTRAVKGRSESAGR
ncbi:hypothetical protein [Kineococcus rubinsiae]|uniref:hypothetical protein n=1 Tax=Kineococcus rubinsiae TaxID=2609562 RepID=UPI0014315ABC|nr:hypothetical protein [Kineococcus rubinsiae]NIZ92034.1 hypothetical protein [Kineococcus rubinsiae]